MSEAIPESRNYTHTRCRTVTAVSENYYTALSDRFSVVPATYCIGCETHFPLDQFTWDDTGELISDARERHAARAPAWARLACGRPGCLGVMSLGLGLGLLAGFGVGQLGGALSWIGPVVGGLAGVVAGMFVFSAMTTAVMRRVYGVEDYRQLR